MSDSPRVDATADITNLTNPPSSLRDSLLRNIYRDSSSISEAGDPHLQEPMEIGGSNSRDLLEGEGPYSEVGPATKRARTHPKSSVDINGTSILNEVEPALALLPQWQKMTEKAVKAIVSIRFSQVNAFDTDPAGASEGSGFIVDAKRGIILTNRHIIGAGPFVGEAILHDHEEIAVHPVYRDPVHDFGFLKFNPEDVKYLKLDEISLRPDLAKMGTDIRVVGNDAGEKLSILSGSISRINRNAPYYGDLTYCDFNTFYLQAASSTSGGSSGSPVLDINGNAVGLQAGGRCEAATDFFLPLDRVARALKFIQEGKPVPRGTIQTQFMHRAFDEARRLGLSKETEAAMRKRFPNEIGMLVAEVIVPNGPSYTLLQNGDVLIAVNGEPLSSFVPLEDVLDSSVGCSVKLDIERGEKSLSFEIPVQDLHSITPSRYLQFSGASFNDLSYQLARSYCVPCQGVYVCDPAGPFKLSGPGHGTIVSSVDDQPTPNLDTFIEVVKKIPHAKRVPIVFYSITDIHTTDWAIVRIDRHWSSFKLATRNDETGLWDFTMLPPALPAIPEEPRTATFPELNQDLKAAQILKHSFVKVVCQLAMKVEGFPRSRCHGGGLILDAQLGIVVVSRNCIPYDLGDIALTFAESVTIPGKVLYLHPTQNFALLSYEPHLVGSTPVRSAIISDAQLQQGHKVNIVGLNQNFRMTSVSTVVADVNYVTIPEESIPRFRCINTNAITVDSPAAQRCGNGVLADDEGRVQALWLSFLGDRKATGHDNEYHFGVDIRVVLPILGPLREGRVPQIHLLDIELGSVDLVQARHLGLPLEWASRYEKADPLQREIFQVRRTEVGSPSAQVLKELDLILLVNGNVATKITDFDVQFHSPMLTITVFRSKQILDLNVPTSKADGSGISRIICWAGACIHEPHKAVLQQSKHMPSRVYVSGRNRGSPSYMYGLVSPLIS
ncbi:hypothetical protein DSO57_1031877 [Entomophthora muscae]|uniref:Uncharacterized protein n=1 Tax=Entomophthora muscae TaxID=34485 RepID=A0ACC2RRJ7_9FUNG|nr:hypothetical protein DSO57_1031877 [Entomophthora muscae]